MSNWEARELSVRQVHYGALDALLCGHVFRGLRLWHASPSACPSCRKMLGVMRDQVREKASLRAARLRMRTASAWPAGSGVITSI